MLKVFPNRILVLPDKFIRGYLTDFYSYLVEMFVKALNVNVVKSSEFNPLQKVDLVVIISIAHWEIEDVDKTGKIPGGVMVVCWHDDVFWRNDRCRTAYNELFDRSKLIIHANRDVHNYMMGRHQGKSRWMPLFAPPYFHQAYNLSPTPRCLLSGHCSPVHYPLRSKLLGSGCQFIDVLAHPGYNVSAGSCVNQVYATKLNSYFCCVMDSGKAYGACRYQINGNERISDRSIDDCLADIMGTELLGRFKLKGQVLLKHFEIPASGALLLTDDNAPELLDIGYIPNVNYVPINEHNAVQVITDCCTNPAKYESVRRTGWLLSKRHTLFDRYIHLVDILKDMDVH